MPYQRSAETLGRLIGRALEDPEIKGGAARAGVAGGFLRTCLQSSMSADIWSAAAGEIDRLDRLQQQVVQAELKERAALPHPSWLASVATEFARAPATFLGWFLGIAGVLYVVSGFFIGWTTAFKWIAGAAVATAQGRWVGWIVGSIAMLVVGTYLWGRRYTQRRERARVVLRQDLGTDGLRQQASEAEQAVEEAVLRKGLLSNLRVIINARLSPSYDEQPTVLAAPGLSEVFDPTYEVPTEAKEKVRRLLETMPGGSVGIAGPRGAGKSTLLLSLCRVSEAKIRGRPVLPVATSAPVQYDARDFVLHLCSSLCQRVLAAEGAEPLHPTWELLNETGPSPVRRWARPLAFASFFIGGALMVLGLLLASAVMPPRPKSQGNAGADTSHSVVQKPDTAGRSSMPTKGGGFGSYVAVLGLNPGAPLNLGLVLLVVSLGLMFVSRIARESEKGGPRTPPSGLARLAMDFLRDVKCQQSYSSGWSGSLKLPIGLEGGVSSAVSLAMNQLSLPEIVDRYRTFLGAVSLEYVVVIGIDEVDKLESDEKAERFLNDVKALFGVEGCFYLVTVSESAISRFERRGLPFRDTFDSSFDDVIYVDYLLLAASKLVLSRRVIGLPVPYVCFCHCLSGGLARDLIRVCRDVLQRVQTSDGATVDAALVFNALVVADLRAKLRGTSIIGRERGSDEGPNTLLGWVHRLETEPTTAGLLLDTSVGLARTAAKTKDYEGATLCAEFSAYLYYLVTLDELFAKAVKAHSFQEIETSETFDQLARARQLLAVSPTLSRRVLTKIRECQSLLIPATFGTKNAPSGSAARH